MEKLGDLINCELRKSGLSVQEFANRISQTRGNIYKIIGKGNLDVELLRKISQVLNHNFFEDVARNLELVNYEEETCEEREREKAIVQFLDVVPKIMTELGRECSILLCNPSAYDSELPFPEYFMCPYAITFTYGETYANRIKEQLVECPQMLRTITDDKGHCVEIIDTLVFDSQCCNIVIDYKTEDEWREMMVFALNTINKHYTPGNKFRLERDNNKRIKW